MQADTPRLAAVVIEEGVDPILCDCEGLPEVIIGATDRDMSRPAACMRQMHACSHNM